MKKNEFLNLLINSGIEKSEAIAELELILELVLKKTKEELLFVENFDDDTILPYIKKRIETKKPIQYVLCQAFFMGEIFYVDENVLIPRPETELLVLSGLEEAFLKAKVLDIGTGSGIIACMLKKRNPTLDVTGVDISDSALEIARKNAKKLNLENISFIKSDIFSSLNEKFDLIISNPPYIPVKMKKTIQREVLFEPDIALYTNDEKGLYFYEKIVESAPYYLNKNGSILFEIMYNQADFIKKILIKNGFFDIKVIKDLSGHERVIKAKLKKVLN